MEVGWLVLGLKLRLARIVAPGLQPRAIQGRCKPLLSAPADLPLAARTLGGYASQKRCHVDRD